jgi:hypothetical protein
MRGKPSTHGCKALTNAGKPCRAAATAGGLCFFHANPNKAAELGRKGGRSNRHPVAENVDPLPRLDNANAIRDAAAQVIAEVHSGKLHQKIGSSLGPLLSLLLRAVETSDQEQRIKDLEKRLSAAEFMGALGGDGDLPSVSSGRLAADETHKA